MREDICFVEMRVLECCLVLAVIGTTPNSFPDSDEERDEGISESVAEMEVGGGGAAAAKEAGGGRGSSSPKEVLGTPVVAFTESFVDLGVFKPKFVGIYKSKTAVAADAADRGEHLNYRQGSELNPLSPIPDSFRELLGYDPRNKRAPYFYGDRMLMRLHPHLRRFVLSQVADDIDNAMMTPMLEYDGEFNAAGYTLLKVIDPPIANRFETVIMELSQYTGAYSEDKFERGIRGGRLHKLRPGNFLIKYQSNCDALMNTMSAVHPLVLERYFISSIEQEANSKGFAGNQITPRVMHLSPPRFLEFEKTAKTDFLMKSETREICIATKATVRYMVMERGGMSVEEMIMSDGSFSFVQGMELLHELITKLQIIHSVGIVHGDIHRGNVVLSPLSLPAGGAAAGAMDVGHDRLSSSKYWLIDFGMARFYSAVTESPPPDKIIVNSISTHWVLRGEAPSFRDDVMQALMTVASAIGGPDHIRWLKGLEKRCDRRELINYFALVNIFTNPVPGIILNLPTHTQIHVEELLAGVRSLTRDDIPDYSHLLGLIKQVIHDIKSPSA